MSAPQLILGSSSRYRRELLSRLGIAFEVVSPDIPEVQHPGESPTQHCLRLAREKAQAVARLRQGECLIIGSDQVLDLDGEAVSKPGDFNTAYAQLRRASGRSLTLHTALAVLDTRSGTLQSEVVPATIEYRSLSEAEIVAYLHREEPYDCAGSVKTESSGIALLRAIRCDDPSALIGLPLIRLCDFLRAAGVVV